MNKSAITDLMIDDLLDLLNVHDESTEASVMIHPFDGSDQTKQFFGKKLYNRFLRAVKVMKSKMGFKHIKINKFFGEHIVKKSKQGI